MTTEAKERTFAEAMQVLHRLQSNRVAIQSSTLSSGQKQRQKLQINKQMLTFLQISSSDIKRMNVVHVAGTKGKGSTCAMVESILRNEGYRTGLFTSPHLMTVRERIRLNGVEMSEAQFAHYFWQVYDKLQALDHQQDSPIFYFGFMTFMALHAFKCEQVNAAIFEVGIGGEYDTTNVIDYPFVTAITSLGLDHTQMLGSTIDQIAWHKSGIFRPHVPAFISHGQSVEALQVLKDRAEERHCPMLICPPFDRYSYDCNAPRVGLEGPVQEMNASLALQLCRYFVDNVSKSKTVSSAEPFRLTATQFDGLRSCRWAGRFERQQVRPGLTLYVDGAHTPESIEHCARWFAGHSRRSTDQQDRITKRVLIFFCTGDRKPRLLLPSLAALSFDTVHFAPYPLTENLLFDGMLENVAEMRSVYERLDRKATVETHRCLTECFNAVMNESNDLCSVDVLVTGSLYLVGNWYKLMNGITEN
jgi:folylpolyglutamate synthase